MFSRVGDIVIDMRSSLSDDAFYIAKKDKTFTHYYGSIAIFITPSNLFSKIWYAASISASL